MTTSAPISLQITVRADIDGTHVVRFGVPGPTTLSPDVEQGITDGLEQLVNTLPLAELLAAAPEALVECTIVVTGAPSDFGTWIRGLRRPVLVGNVGHAPSRTVSTTGGGP